MPAPADPIKRQIWLQKLSLAHRGRIVIYCDGDYWHKGDWAKRHNVVRKDNWQTKILENSGYKVFRFSETEINSSADRCATLVKSYIQNSL